MKRSSKRMLFGVGLFLLAVAIAPPKSQSSGSAPVLVTNTPLPVQGNVGVNNLPAVQSVSGTVSVGNTPSVNIANTPTVNLAGGSGVSVSNPLDSQSNPSPLVTLEAAQPYEDACRASIPAGQSYGTCNFQTVPTGKRLVIEEVDALLQVDSGLKPTWLGVITPQHKFEHYLIAMPMSGNGELDYFAAHQQTRLYVDASQSPLCIVQLNGSPTNNIDSTNFQISGFLVDTQ